MGAQSVQTFADRGEKKRGKEEEQLDKTMPEGKKEREKKVSRSVMLLMDLAITTGSWLPSDTI
jgi:hypothetical protein